MKKEILINHKERVKDIAREIAGSRTQGFTKEWEAYRESQYKYWLKRIRWACLQLRKTAK